MAKSPKVQPARVEPNHAPITIPAGSYDREALDAGLDKAVDTYGTNRETELNKALETARVEPEGASANRNPAALPDHKFVEVPLALGEDGQPTQVEVIQVYDESKADQHQAAQQPVLGTTTQLIDAEGKPTDLEKARMEAVKGDGLENTDTSPSAPLAPAETQQPPAGQGDENQNAEG